MNWEMVRGIIVCALCAKITLIVFEHLGWIVKTASYGEF